MKTLVAGKTDRGLVRSNNEDNFVIDEKIKFFAVADGAGGQATGEIASQLAINITKQQLEKYFKGENIFFGSTLPNFSNRTNALVSSVRFANQIVFEASKKYPQNQGMATTCVAVFVGENGFSYCNVGDSRIYLLRDGELKLITTDHSLVMEQLKRGLINKEQAEKSEYRNVLTRALGTGQSVEIDMDEMRAKDGDILLLCSDGLIRMVKDNVIYKTLQDKLSQGNTLSDTCDTLINLAVDSGGSDNITVVLVQLLNENKGLFRFFQKIWGNISR